MSWQDDPIVDQKNTPGQIEPGNIDLYAQPEVKNADGSISTVDSFSVDVNGREVLLPTVMPDGRHLSQDQAFAEFSRTGRHLGAFDNPDNATAYAIKLHNDYAAGKYRRPVQSPVQSAPWQNDPIIDQPQIDLPGRLDAQALPADEIHTPESDYQLMQGARALTAPGSEWQTPRDIIADQQAQEGKFHYLRNAFAVEDWIAALPSYTPGESGERAFNARLYKGPNNPFPPQVLAAFQQLHPSHQRELWAQLQEKLQGQQPQLTNYQSAGAGMGEGFQGLKKAYAGLEELAHPQPPPGQSMQSGPAPGQDMRESADRELERLSHVQSEPGTAETARGVASAGTQLIPAIVSGPAAPAVMGLQGSGAAMTASREIMAANGINPDDYRNRRTLQAVAQGAIDAATMYMGGQGVKGAAAMAGAMAIQNATGQIGQGLVTGQGGLDFNELIKAAAQGVWFHYMTHPGEITGILPQHAPAIPEIRTSGTEYPELRQRRGGPQEGGAIPTAAEEQAAEFQPKGEPNALQEPGADELGPYPRGDQSTGGSRQGEGVGRGQQAPPPPRSDQLPIAEQRAQEEAANAAQNQSQAQGSLYENSSWLEQSQQPRDELPQREDQAQANPQGQTSDQAIGGESVAGGTHDENITPAAPPAKTRFSRADLEQQLLDYHERTGGTQESADQSELDQAASGDAFAFRDKLPEEVRNYLEGRPNLRRRVRVFKKGESGYENAGGMDALSHVGEDRYFAMLDRSASDTLPAALEAARKSPEPDIAFLAAVHDNLPPPREGVAMEWTDAQKLRPGQSFEIGGHKFRVMEDEQGYRVLKDGEDYPITPVDALERIPIDKGTIDQAAPEPAVLSAFERKAEAAKARLKERFSRQGERLAKRTAGGSFLDPLFEADVLKDLAVVGAHAIYKGVRNLKDFTTHMVQEVGEWVRPHMRKLYMEARKAYNASSAEDKMARRIIREQGVPAKREKTLTTVNRNTGYFTRDPTIVIGEVKLLRTYLRKLQGATGRAYEAGAREKKLDLQGLKRQFVNIIRQSLPASEHGKLIGDVANITTRAQMDLALRKAENVLADAQMRQAVKEVEQLAGTMEVAAPRPRIKRQPGAPAPGPEGVPMRKVNLKKLEPERRMRVRKLITDATQLKRDAVAANTTEQKRTLTDKLNRIQAEIKQEVADHVAQREVMIGEKLAQREDVVQGMVQKIAAEPSPTPPTSAPIKEAPLAKVGHFLGRTNLSPETLSQSLFGEGSDGHQIAIDNIRSAQNAFLAERHAFNDHMAKAFTEAGIEPGTRKLDKWINDRHSVQLPDAGELHMTRNEMLEIVAAAADPETAQLVADGIEWNFASRPRDKSIALTPHDIEKLGEQLTPGEKGLIDAFRKYNKDNLTTPAFEAKLRISGSAPDPHENYFPRARNRTQVETQGLAEGWKGLRRKYLENVSSMEERSTDSTAPLLVKGFLETAYAYADDAAKLIHMAEPVRDAAMVFEDPRLKGAIQRKYGESMNTRFRQLLDDTLGMKVTPGGTDRAINTLAGNVSRAYLQLNPKPMLKNVIGGTAMILPEFEVQDFAAGVGKMFSGEVYDRMLQNSGVAWDRYNAGLYGQYSPMAERHNQAVANMSVGEALKAGEVGRAIDAIPFMKWADSVPLRAAYAAAEHMVQRQHPEWTASQKLEATLKKFHEVIYRSQNGTSSTEISGLASEARQSPIKQLLLMFKSDRNKKYNGIIRAWNQGDATYRAKMVAALALSAAASGFVGYGVNEAMSMLGSAIGGKPIDRKEELKQRKNAGLTILRELAGDVPLGEATETIVEAAIKKRREVNLQNPVEQTVADLANAIIDVAIAASSPKGRAKLGSKGEEVALHLATLLGLPIEPAYRLGKRIYQGARGR